MKLKLIIAHLTFKLEKQRSSEGFTLIELLVVIIVIGILSAIAMPNLLTQVGKAREAEAREVLSAIGQAQQAYFFERAIFANNIADLDVPLQENYYNFPNPTIVGVNTVKHPANAQNAAFNGTRNYSLGVYNNSGQFSLVLCRSANNGGLAEAPDATIDPCVSGVPVQ